MTVHIVADSACDLPLEFYEKHGVTLLPLGVHIEENDYRDLVTISPKEVYDAMREGKIAKTTQISPLDVKETFTEFAKKQVPVLYVAFSSELSGTYQTAVMIGNEVKEEYPDFELSIVDSKCASLGLGLSVKYAVDLASKGNTLQEIEASVKDFCEHTEHIFTVDNLEYLARGGRISKASAFVGGLLNIKPLLHVEGGKLIPLEKLRGRKKVFRRVIELMKERGVNLESQTIAISHGDDEDSAKEIKTMIETEFHPKEVYINTVGCSVGAHSGPGTIAIFFSNKPIS